MIPNCRSFRAEGPEAPEAQKTAPQMKPIAKPTYIPGLDGIRACAVLIVIVGHFGLGHIVPGGLGVTIFFAISGFLITSLLLEEYERDGSISVFAFYARRFLRLMPKLLGLLLFSTLIGLAIGDRPGLMDYLSALFYFTNYLSIYQQHQVLATGTGFEIYWPQLWSLAVEEHYYLTFPLAMALLAGRKRALLALVIGVIVLSLALRLAWVKSGHPLASVAFPYPYLASETRMDSIAYGALFALLQHHARAVQYMPGRWLLNAALIGGVALLLASLLYRDPGFRESFRYSLQGIAMMLIFFHLYMGARSPLEWILEIAPLKFLGVLSYCAYLWHMEYVRVMEKFVPLASLKGGDLALYIFAGTGLTFVVACLSYELLARPAARLRRRFGSHSA
jgi:peptidoglycan/LPS O-acetylase OafA/YrhL